MHVYEWVCISVSACVSLCLSFCSVRTKKKITSNSQQQPTQKKQAKEKQMQAIIDAANKEFKKQR
jgi:heme exporter protein D